MVEPSGHRSAVVTPGAGVIAETLGTFMLTLSGTATVLAVHKLRGGAPTVFTAADDVAISMAFAFGVIAAVYVLASVSGAHLNPAVTVALAAVRKFPWSKVPGYVLAQFVGAVLAGLMNWLMFGNELRQALILGATRPGADIAWYTALVTEFVITLVLMVVIMATAVYQRPPGGPTQSGLAIGLWIGAAIFFALPISGGALNPARALGPDIAALQFPFWWIYLIGPVCGALAGAALWVYVLAQDHPETTEVIEAGIPQQVSPTTARPVSSGRGGRRSERSILRR
jgi:MIP family channel proteins